MNINDDDDQEKIREEIRKALESDNYEELMLSLMHRMSDRRKVARALRIFLKFPLNGCEATTCAAMILGSVVRVCPNPTLALHFFLSVLTKEMPELKAVIQEERVDRTTNP